MTCSTQSQTKKVTFAGGNTVHLIEQIEELDTETIWYQADEFYELKLQGRIDAKKWRRSGLGLLLQDTFEDPIEASQEHLNAYCQLEGSRFHRGLERFLSRKHGEQRTALKNRARGCVLLHQRSLREQDLNQCDILEEMSLNYRDISRPATDFAHKIAKADEYALLNGSSDEAADSILKQYSTPHNNRMPRRRSSNFSLGSTDSFDSFQLPANFAVNFRRKSRLYRCHPQAPTLAEEFIPAMTCL